MLVLKGQAIISLLCTTENAQRLNIIAQATFYCALSLGGKSRAIRAKKKTNRTRAFRITHRQMKRHSMTLPHHVPCGERLPVRLQRGSSESGAYQRIGQKSSAHRSSDNAVQYAPHTHAVANLYACMYRRTRVV